MQSNTTGHSMEIFFITFQCFLLGFLVARNIALSKKINSIEKNCDFFQRKFITTMDVHGEDFDRLEDRINAVVEAIKADNHRSSQAILERLDAAKPIKPNNWDSVKEAFKGPVRVEINERN